MTKHDLKQIRDLEREIRMLQNKLANLLNRSLVQSPAINAIHNTVISDKVGKRAEDKDNLEFLLNEKRKEYQQLRNEAVKFIHDIPDSFTRQLLTCRYIDGMSWKQVASQIGGSNTEDSVRMACDRFMKKN